MGGLPAADQARGWDIRRHRESDLTENPGRCCRRPGFSEDSLLSPLPYGVNRLILSCSSECLMDALVLFHTTWRTFVRHRNWPALSGSHLASNSLRALKHTRGRCSGSAAGNNRHPAQSVVPFCRQAGLVSFFWAGSKVLPSHMKHPAQYKQA